MRFLTGAFLLTLVAWAQASAVDLWIDVIRNPLQGPNGRQYFESTVKDALIPGGINGIHEFRGTLLSAKPAEAHDSGKVAKLARPVPPGAVIYFSGVPTAFAVNPFMLTMEVEVGNFGSARFPELVEQVLPPLIVALAEQPHQVPAGVQAEGLGRAR